MSNQTVEIQRYIESMMINLAMDKEDYSFHEAMEICHWMGRRVRPVGAEWYISAAMQGGRYAIRVNNSGNEYITQPEHLMVRWEVLN
ncbi:hypothetical protein CPTAKMNP4_250 [Salmonella phage vB_SenM-AKM_NP4]|uniref:Uncharacterized protein n=1 Tax=Salmonella phage S16 TaxID=1087482 RepID=M1H9A3_BPS16|nr:hypothetical protein I133_gp016 [Salmonella phage vB_SenM-S16]AGE48214.1 hypothetical protein [Salmonella phage vB_SenM-S16]WDR21915.1 hypothetical protein PJM34_0247 [Salmonella phage vB_SenM_UTK0003]WLI71872.1 hypothetical protein CPTAKMNP4_250 [Salmonella phage vB_SenM-AKM_NP4]